MVPALLGSVVKLDLVANMAMDKGNRCFAILTFELSSLDMSVSFALKPGTTTPNGAAMRTAALVG